MLSFKKLLGIISVVIFVMFVMMLTTSYAWYSFENAKTSFEVATNNDNVEIYFQRGEYINTNVAVPITSSQVAKYSEKSNFTVRVKNNPIDNEILLTVSLVDISIDGALQKDNFKIALYYQGSIVATIPGNTVGGNGETTKTLGSVVLNPDVLNNFEIRVFILDDGTDQSSMMNKTFQATVKTDVVSRLKTTIKDFDDADILISSITIDGETSDHIPINGYYSMTSTCQKGSNLSWDPLKKTINYAPGSYINDSCALAFTTSTDYPLLSEMPVGSYVAYTGNNGCMGKSCSGQNANYVDDNNMGYCDDLGYKFHENGWRIGYIENGSAYLISAGAPECVATYVDSKVDSLQSVTLSTNYYYGSGYTFDESTGQFTLTGVSSEPLVWSSNYNNIIANTPYTCRKTSSTATCSILYEIVIYENSIGGQYYAHFNYEIDSDLPIHLANLNNRALKYCNSNFAKNGICNSTTAWAMNADDFEKIMGKTLSACDNTSADKTCGYNNDLIDNGSYYWFAKPTNSYFFLAWRPQGAPNIDDMDNSSKSHGLRPVMLLDTTVVVIGGSGTYEDPYLLGLN